MLIYIVRHGQAHGGSNTGLDQDRTLTQLGHEQARAVGVYLSGCDITPLCVIASHFIRAKETAGEICDVLGQEKITDNRLGADRGLTEMLAVVEDYRGKEAVAIVSHMPTVGCLRTLLTDGPTASASSLSTGEVVVVRADSDELVGNCVFVERYRLER